MGPRRAGRLRDSRAASPGRKSDRDRGRAHHGKLPCQAWNKSPRGVFLGRHGSQSAATGGRHRGSDGDGLFAARDRIAHRRHGAGIGDNVHHEASRRSGFLEARKIGKPDPDAARRDCRCQQSRLAPQCPSRRSAGRPGSSPGAKKTYDFRSERPRLGRHQYHRGGSGGTTNSAKAESRQGPGDRRISLEQDRALMRILKLSPQIEKRLLARRTQRDEEAHAVASEIVADVRKRGDSALFAWAKKLDHVDLAHDGVRISRKEIRSAGKRVGSDFLRATERAAKNVRSVAEKQMPRPWSIDSEPGVRISQRVSPIESIGCYIPGGQFSLVSTLIMTAVPAKISRVSDIIIVCPNPSPGLMATASFLGIEKIARIGGAQAIAALAYGTKSIPRVEKIFGPGNKYVTAAKQLVSADCAIDLPAGPTAALVRAAESNARWIAADLLAPPE